MGTRAERRRSPWPLRARLHLGLHGHARLDFVSYMLGTPLRRAGVPTARTHLCVAAAWPKVRLTIMDREASSRR